MRGGRLPIDWEQAAGAATVGGFVATIVGWFAMRRESAQQKRDENIAAIAVKVVEESGKFPLAQVQKVVNDHLTNAIADVKGEVKDLRNYVQGELPAEIARHITLSNSRIPIKKDE
jgi:hypothetical protein